MLYRTVTNIVEIIQLVVCSHSHESLNRVKKNAAELITTQCSTFTFGYNIIIAVYWTFYKLKTMHRKGLNCHFHKLNTSPSG